MADLTVRVLTPDDLPAVYALASLTFGGERQAPPPEPEERPGRHAWGTFDARGRLVAQAIDREQQHWFGGRLVPATGLAAVAVEPELRSRGVGRTLLTRLLSEARDRGAVVATLFPTTPSPYRALGCEEVGALTWWSLPTSDLAGLPRPEGVELRRADAEDLKVLLELYGELARAGNGLLDRTGPLFDTTAAGVVDGHDGVSVAVGASGEVEGYVSWDRTGGYDDSGVVRVADLIGRTGEATRALLGALGTWASVAPMLHLRLPDDDPAFLVAPVPHLGLAERHPWMLRLLDAAGAVSVRGWPPDLDASVDLELHDALWPANAGPHRLVLSGGEGRLEPGGSGTVRLGPRGLAVLYAGAGEPAVLRRAGLLEGGDARTDAFLRAASAGPRPALLDYF